MQRILDFLKLLHNNKNNDILKERILKLLEIVTTFQLKYRSITKASFGNILENSSILFKKKNYTSGP